MRDKLLEILNRNLAPWTFTGEEPFTTELLTLLGSGWQDIASAPKDASDFMLLWCADVSETGIVGYWSGRRWEFAHCDSAPFQPTHWMPLPLPPVTADKEQE